VSEMKTATGSTLEPCQSSSHLCGALVPRGPYISMTQIPIWISGMVVSRTLIRSSGPCLDMGSAAGVPCDLSARGTNSDSNWGYDRCRCRGFSGFPEMATYYPGLDGLDHRYYYSFLHSRQPLSKHVDIRPDDDLVRLC